MLCCKGNNKFSKHIKLWKKKYMMIKKEQSQCRSRAHTALADRSKIPMHNNHGKILASHEAIGEETCPTTSKESS